MVPYSAQFETVFNICLGFSPFIDNWMHLGGFFAGFFLGLGLFTRARTLAAICAPTRSVGSLDRQIRTPPNARYSTCARALFVSPVARRSTHLVVLCTRMQATSRA